MKKAIISVLLGKYDELQPAPKFKGWDTILFTDHHYPDNKGWTINKVKSQNPASDSRYYKWLSHITLPMYTTICYIDANMRLIQEPPQESTWFRHPARTTVQEEANRILYLKKSPKEVVLQQLEYYKQQGFKDKTGMYQNGFFVRTQDALTNNLCEIVYNLTTQYSHRDQLAMPFALYKTNFKMENLLSGPQSRKYIKLHPHLKTGVMPQPQVKKIQVSSGIKPNVHHITPGRSDKNFGKAINDIVKNLPDQDWICLRDIDTMPGYHEKFFNQIEEIAAQNTHGLVSCFTNRLGLRYQVHNNQISNNTCWLHHREIAKQRYKQYGSEVQTTNQTIGGVLMLFPKQVWQAVGGFPEGGISVNNSFIDYHFSVAVQKAKYKIGIAQGVYLIHMYRPEAKHPRMSTQHLR